jgi:hypothetical protein
MSIRNTQKQYEAERITIPKTAQPKESFNLAQNILPTSSELNKNSKEM